MSIRKVRADGGIKHEKDKTASRKNAYCDSGGNGSFIHDSIRCLSVLSTTCVHGMWNVAIANNGCKLRQMKSPRIQWG